MLCRECLAKAGMGHPPRRLARSKTPKLPLSATRDSPPSESLDGSSARIQSARRLSTAAPDRSLLTARQTLPRIPLQAPPTPQLPALARIPSRNPSPSPLQTAPPSRLQTLPRPRLPALPWIQLQTLPPSRLQTLVSSCLQTPLRALLQTLPPSRLQTLPMGPPLHFPGETIDPPSLDPVAELGPGFGNLPSVYLGSLPEPRAVSTKYRGKGRPFIDHAVLKVSAGKGGDGGISFARGPHEPFGPPSGGLGGRGGDVFLEANPDVFCLSNLERSYKAEDGHPGKDASKNGKGGKDIVIQVPLGTILRQVRPPLHEFRSLLLKDKELHQALRHDPVTYLHHYFKFSAGYEPREDRQELLLDMVPTRARPRPLVELDLSTPGERVCVAQGGRGGVGNPFFMSQSIPGPRFAGRGAPGASLYLELELKAIADMGFIGFPNAGKSTLLSALTRAAPKIASYPFTTLHPNMGVMQNLDAHSGPDDVEIRRGIRLADIPGLISGASQNVGLGHAFLRHVERSLALVFVVSLENPDPAQDLMVLRRELGLYNADLLARRAVVIGNKADVVGAQARFENLVNVVKGLDPSIPVVPVSAKMGKGVHKVIRVLSEAVKSLRDDAEGS